MAATMGHMSMLPAITCSNCGADVDLAMMGDHVCSASHTGAPPVPTLYDRLPMSQPELPQPFAHPPGPVNAAASRPSNFVVTTPSGGHRMNLGPVGTAIPPRQPPPVESAEASSSVGAQPEPVTEQPPIPEYTYAKPDSPASTSTSNPYFWQPAPQTGDASDWDASPAATSPASAPAASLFDVASPHSPLIPSPLSAPAPLSDRPESAAIFHQYTRTDSLVPPPPPAKSAARQKQVPAPLQLSAERATEEGHLAPLSPVPNGANVLRRMDTIVPGPFDSRHRKTDSRDGASKGFSLFRRKSTKRNKLSISSPTSMADAPPVPTAEPSLFVGGSLDTSSPVEEQPRYSKLDNFGQPLPNGPPPPRPDRPGEVDGLLEKLQSTAIDSPGDGSWNGSGSPLGHSDQALRDLNGSAPTQGSTAAYGASRVTSDMSVYTTVSGSDRSTMLGKELPQIREDEDLEAENEADADAPPAWPTGRLRSASRSAEGSSPKVEQVPPVPNINSSEEPASLQHRVQQLQHTPSESVSSQDFGSVSDGRRESSRSSPPTSTTSSFSPGKQSMDDQQDVNRTAGEMPTSPAFNRAANFSRPRAPTESSTQSPPKIFAEPASPMLPSESNITKVQEIDRTPRPSPLQLSMPPPRKASLVGGLQLPPRLASRNPHYAGPGTFADAPPSPMLPVTPNFAPPLALPLPPSSLVPASERRLNAPRNRSGTAKRCCRGCDLPIEGKSVKASDGRLTGRYHRECFVCKSCKERFPTADFYILDDHPFCAQHYHELNGSICVDCGKGIEGRYIDTVGERKHHVYCFTCSECSKPLSQDYFEIDGRFYCEADAGKVHQKSSMLAPGRKFPERRTTTLMMM